MRQYTIFTDGGMDVPEHFWAETGVKGIQMDYLLGGENHSYSPSQPKEALCDAFYAQLRQRIDISTTQINPFAFESVFVPELEAGRDVLYCGFSGGLSATFSVAQGVAQQLNQRYPDRKVHCVDSKCASVGGGIFLQRAASNQAAGLSLEENAADLETYGLHVCHWFTVSDLDFLKRGGRVSPAVAFVGGKLNIKPILIIDEAGKLIVTAKVRGMASSMKWMVDKMAATLPQSGEPLVYVTHAGAKEKADELIAMIKQAAPHAKVECTPLSPIIGAHTGPDMLAVCHWSPEIHR